MLFRLREGRPIVIVWYRWRDCVHRWAWGIKVFRTETGRHGSAHLGALKLMW